MTAIPNVETRIPESSPKLKRAARRDLIAYLNQPKDSPRVVPPPSSASPRLRLAPLHDVDDHAQTRLVHGTAQCPICEKHVTAAAIIIAEPKFLESFNGYTGWTQLATMYCSHCNCLIHRLHASTAEGRMGEPIGGHDEVRDRRKIDAFLTAHPESAGVL